MSSFDISILAADHPFFKGKCTSVSLPTSDSSIGVRAGHSNMIAASVPRILMFKDEKGEDHEVAVSEGLFKMEGGRALVLVDSAERPDEIDINRAKRDAEKTREDLLHQKSRQEYLMAQANLARALTRLKITNQKSQNN